MKYLFNKLINFLITVGLPKNCKSCEHRGMPGCTYNENCTMNKKNLIYPPSPEQEEMWKDYDERKLHEYYLSQPPY